MVTDRDVYGKGVGAWFGTYAQQLGLNVVASKSIRRQRSYRGLARSLKGADCFEEYLDAEGTTLREPVLL